MKTLFAALLLSLSTAAFGAANEFAIDQRNALNSGWNVRYFTPTPSQDAFFYLKANGTIGYLTMGPHLDSSTGTLNLSGLSAVATSGAYADLTGAPALAAVATSGAYTDLSGRPVLGTAAYVSASTFATAAQGTLADTAVQPAGLTWAAIIGKPSFGALALQSTITLSQISDMTGTGAAVASAANAGAARTAIGAGTSSFDGTWGSLTGKPTFATVATSGSYNDLLNKPTIPTATQRLRVQTDSAGVYTWTYPSAYGAGVIPVIELTVEDNTAGATWNHKITAISNTSVTIQLGKTTAVTILGISVLGIAASPQAFVHLTAIAP